MWVKSHRNAKLMKTFSICSAIHSIERIIKGRAIVSKAKTLATHNSFGRCRESINCLCIRLSASTQQKQNTSKGASETNRINKYLMITSCSKRRWTKHRLRDERGRDFGDTLAKRELFLHSCAHINDNRTPFRLTHRD